MFTTTGFLAFYFVVGAFFGSLTAISAALIIGLDATAFARAGAAIGGIVSVAFVLNAIRTPRPTNGEISPDREF